MEFDPSQHFGVISTLDTVKFEENNRILLKKSKLCIYDFKSQPGLFLHCS